MQSGNHSRRAFVKRLGATAATMSLATKGWARSGGSEYNVLRFGAVGDGTTLDGAAIQRAIDACAAAGGGRVLLPGGHRFLSGALLLAASVELHLADDVQLLASPNQVDYTVPGRGVQAGLVNADGAVGVKLSGTGNLDGQAMLFMNGYSKTDMRWEPKPFRPRMFSLRRCTDLQITDISFSHAPNWGLHMLGCERVLVDGLRIRNYMDVPNCDGIDPDHCRDVEIRNCDIVSADDAIVVKTSQQDEDYGPSHNITVRDCVVQSRDSGLKIGTETFGNISKILFERCQVKASGRGPTITHRQPGNIEDIEFRDIELTAEHHAARWWGWGEAVSVTAWPRTPDGHVGTLKNVRLRNIKGRAENSVRIDGQPDQPVEDVLLENIDITIDKWTDFPGGHFDNRPTPPSMQGLEPHGTPVFFLRNVKNATLRHCTAQWGKNIQPDFTYALEAEHVTGLHLEHFHGTAAHPQRDPATKIVD